MLFFIALIFHQPKEILIAALVAEVAFYVVSAFKSRAAKG